MASEPVKFGAREVPAIKPNAVEIDLDGNKTKSWVITMPDSVTLQDIQDQPEMWRLVQASHKALAEDHHVELRWFDRRAYGVVDWADSDGVGFLKLDVKKKGDRTRTPYQDDNFEVRWAPEGWTYYRRSDGVRMSNSSWHTWEAARGALLREMYPQKMGA